MFYRVYDTLDDKIYAAATCDKDYARMLDQAEFTGFLIIDNVHYVNMLCPLYLADYLGVEGRALAGDWLEFDDQALKGVGHGIFGGNKTA